MHTACTLLESSQKMNSVSTQSIIFIAKQNCMCNNISRTYKNKKESEVFIDECIKEYEFN